MIQGTSIVVNNVITACLMSKCVCVFFFRFYWQYKHSLLGMSEALIEWHVDQHVKPGVYRLGYFGNSRASFSK